MIRLEGVKAGHIGPVSFEVKRGESAKIITCSQEDKTLLLRSMLGLRRPESGSVFLFGHDVYSIPEGEYIKLYRRAGVVLESGGVISNLKVWENIALTTWYHTGRRPAEIEERMLDIYARIGVSRPHLEGLMGKLPGPLPVQEKRLIGLVRAMLAEPELMVYDSPFDGLDHEMQERVARLTEEFHAQRDGRTSVYVAASAGHLKAVRAEHVIDLSAEGTEGQVCDI